MKENRIIAGVLIVIFALMSLLLFLYGSHLKNSVERYSFHRAINNQLMVKFGNNLVAFDKTNTEVAHHALSDLNIQAHGDFDFFSNGDLLVYQLSEKPGILYKLSRFLRLKKKTEQEPNNNNGFYRCKLQQKTCIPYNTSLPVLKSAFRLWLFRNSDNIVLADSPAFKLYLIDAKGSTITSSNDNSFRFPNQMVYVKEQLWLADTNNHRLVQLHFGEDNFAEVRNSFSVDLGGVYKWPFQIAHDGENWWINVGDNKLANGRIIKLDHQGNLLFELSAKAARLTDPLAISFWNEALWVSDFKEPLIARFSSEGKRLSPPSSTTLEKLKSEVERQIRQGQLYSYAGMVLGALVFLFGLLAAWKLDKARTKEHFNLFGPSPMEEHINQVPAAAPTNRIHWIKNTLRKYRILATMLATGLPFIVTVASIYLLLNSNKAADILWASLPLLFFIYLICATVWFFYNKLQQQKLGVIKESICLEIKGDRKTIAKAEEIIYNERLISANGITVLIGHPRKRIFKPEELNSHIIPRLKEARKCNEWEALKLIWKEHYPYFLGMLLLFFIFPITAILNII
ncbi:hypothetical protein SAMN02745866_03409 [Alteromonadaceae bacterium Bs31]|nr:hypothetical protein SAMN02745866_03409 [Alteromonadaceae bacterium Bs31]